MIRCIVVLTASLALAACGSDDIDAPEVSRTGVALCGDPAIRGNVMPRISEGTCGVDNPVQVVEVSGVALTQSSIIDCPTARALRRWVDEGLRPAVGRRGGGVDSLKVAAHYACRTINSRPGGSLSEHAKGKAIDISAIILRDGDTITVAEDWGRGGEGRVLRQAHQSACGPFGTVLGPEADRFHRDHFHFDSKSRRRPYCR